MPKVRDSSILTLLSLAAIAIAGYHPGLEDDAYYLAAIRSRLNPALFPHDADFFRLQFQATIFDRLIAWSVQLMHLPAEWVILAWHFASILAILACCHAIVTRCFCESHARWAAVGLVAALLTIPVSGTGISLVDQYLHPRALATALILCAVVAIFERRTALAACLVAVAFALHAIMAAFGISLCLFLSWPRSRQFPAAAAIMPLGWVFDPASDAWRQAAATRTFYFLARWDWYEWLGVVAPLAILWWFSVLPIAKDRLGWIARRLFWFGAFQMFVGLEIMLPSGFERLRPFEPMRYLQLIYIFMFLLGGGLIGHYILKRHVYRWALLFIPLCFGMFVAQRGMYPATAHLELPGTAQRNDWVRAFEWVRNNTPADSLFALDPEYMALPGEDYHGFRALAERSMLADNLKDPGMVARVPRLADRWLTEVSARKNWRHFGAADFASLSTKFGVNWVVVTAPGVTGLQCPYENGVVRVCRLP